MPQASPGCSGGPTTFPAAEALLRPRSYQRSCKASQGAVIAAVPGREHQ